MREKQQYPRVRVCNPGITPACAGKTSSVVCLFFGFWDHPRVCGKNAIADEIIKNFLGSPPRVREKRYNHIQVLSFCRITPACAGKTSTTFFLFMSFRDHPRVCGKNTVCQTYQCIPLGSPPRVREKLTVRVWQHARNRITPACAGKTFAKRLATNDTQDHPRVCGKNWNSNIGSDSKIGSPPRVREKRTYYIDYQSNSGITPACAGKTFAFKD